MEPERIKEEILYYLSKILAYPLIPPEHAYLILTTKCNLKCKICNITASSNPELSTDRWKDFIFQIKNLGIKQIIFSGGEPILREDICELVSYASYIKIPIIDIITNGTLIDKYLLDKLLKNGLTNLTISVDGMEREHDYIRGKGNFEKIINLMEIIKELKDIYNFVTTINFTIVKSNIHSILEILKFANKYRFNSLCYQPLLSDNRQMDMRKSHSLWPQGWDLWILGKKLKKLNMVRKNTQVNVYTPEYAINEISNYFKGEKIRNVDCYEGIKRIVISENGLIWTCKGVMGNLLEDSLTKIWFSNKAMLIREKVKDCQNICLQGCISGLSRIKLIKKMRAWKKNNKAYLDNLCNEFVEKISSLRESGYLIKEKVITSLRFIEELKRI
jgi:MoaA/NifB/PqqE/SkfB family radical SAM enzyme